jgi:hypothetical protein
MGRKSIRIGLVFGYILSSLLHAAAHFDVGSALTF